MSWGWALGKLSRIFHNMTHEDWAKRQATILALQKLFGLHSCMDLWLTKINLHTVLHYFQSMNQTTTNLQPDHPTLKTFLCLLTFQVYFLKHGLALPLNVVHPPPALMGSYRSYKINN